MSAMSCRRLALFGAVFSALAAPAAVSAQEATYSFNIPAQDLGAALRAYAEASRQQISFDGETVRGRHSASLVGRYSAEAGLRALLAGTGLSFTRAAHGVLMIATAAPVAAVSGPGDGGQVAEVVVTGTHIRGPSNVAAPSLTITRQDIENTDFSSVQAVFQKLPQNFSEVTPAGRFANEGGSQLRGLNNTYVSALDLRGLGAQSTLTLLDGKRVAGSIGGRVVDVSTIPLSVIDRVEIVTGGRSAVYGSDAVAGVVNLVTRRDFQGVEGEAYYGGSANGGERLQSSVTTGGSWDRGGFIVAYDHERDWTLDLGKAGLLTLANNPVIDLTQLSLNAQPNMWRDSVFAAGRYRLNDRVEVYGEGLYSFKKTKDYSERYFLGAGANSTTSNLGRSETYDLSGGVKVDLGAGWRVDVSGATSRTLEDLSNDIFIDLGFFAFSRHSQEVDRSGLSSVTMVADGPLPSFAGVTPRLAVGAEARRDSFESRLDGALSFDEDRTVQSLFGELLVPVVSDGATPGLRRLELSLAGRYDHYSDFGGTFNPQAGAAWDLFDGFGLRAAYSRAFRAPALAERATPVDAFLEVANDPQAGGAAVPVLFWQGPNSALGPEKAETWSAGFDWRPRFAPDAHLGVSYFNIRYDGRIEQPTINNDRSLVLERADRFPGLIDRNPTPAEIAAIVASDAQGFIENDTGLPWDPDHQTLLQAFPGLIVFDNRTSNIAREKLSGIDLLAEDRLTTRWGELQLGLNLTYTIDHERRVTATSPDFSLLNEVGKPVGLKARATLGWTRGPYSAFLYVNYADGYENPFSTPPSRMASWTTADLTLSFDSSEVVDGGPLDDIRASISVSNLFDAAPPRFEGSLLGVLYDSVNASPFGRYVSFRVAKRW